MVLFILCLCRRITLVFMACMFNWKLDTWQITLILWVLVIRHQVLLDSAFGWAIMIGPYHLQTVILTDLGCSSFAVSKDCCAFRMTIQKIPELRLSFWVNSNLLTNLPIPLHSKSPQCKWFLNLQGVLWCVSCSPWLKIQTSTFN